MEYLIGGLTDQGRVRELNEDSFLVLTQPNLPSNVSLLLAVADGMGGHQAGDVASGQVIATLDRFFSTGQFQQLVDYNPNRSDYYAAVLKDVLEAINEYIVDISNQPGLAGMGTTATVALLSGRQLFIGHVGDSRGYLLRGGLLQQITQDHSWVADQVAIGAITPGEAYHHPKKNLLLRALGHNIALRVDRTIQDVYPGDSIILCSDGLSNKVSDAEIAHIVTAQIEPQLACQQLVNLANQRGGEDNITVIIARLNEFSGQSNLSGNTPKKHLNNQLERNLNDTEKIVRQAAAKRPKVHPPADYGIKTESQKDKVQTEAKPEERLQKRPAPVLTQPRHTSVYQEEADQATAYSLSAKYFSRSKTVAFLILFVLLTSGAITLTWLIGSRYANFPSPTLFMWSVFLGLATGLGFIIGVSFNQLFLFMFGSRE